MQDFKMAEFVASSSSSSTSSTPLAINSDVMEFVTSASKKFMSMAGAQIVQISDPAQKEEEEEYSVESLNFFMSGVVAPVLCICGMIGNILAVIVWNKPGMASSTSRYLTAQSISDFCVLFFFFFNECLQAWKPAIVSGTTYGYYFSYIGFPVYFFFVMAHVWCTVGVTLDLYIMVCLVLKAKSFCNTKVANIFIFNVFVLGFIVNIPHFFNFRPTPSTPTTTNNNKNNNNINNNTNNNNNTNINSSIAMINATNYNNYYHNDNNKTNLLGFEMTEFGAGPRGMWYEFCIHCVFLIMIPWTSVFVMNVKILSTIIRSNQRMADKKSTQSAKNSKQTEAQITRLLLGVTFSFLVFVGINCAVHCPWMLRPPTVDKHLVNSSFMFAKTGMVFNASSHFMFYCILGKRFRSELRRLVCTKLFNQGSPSHLLGSKTQRSSDTTISVTK